MNYAIEHQTINYPFLVITPRKKALKNSLIAIKEGLVLVKLGKQEFTVEPGQNVWIPFGCLVSLTYFPSTQVQQLTFSPRLIESFAKQAGLVHVSELSSAIMTKLECIGNTNNTTDQHSADLLNVLKVELGTLKPKFNPTALSDAINHWRHDDENEPSPLLDQSQLLVLSLREAKKRLQSGQKPDSVVNALFLGKQEEFEWLWQLCFGEEFSK